MEKPITIIREDFIKSFATLINESGLPPFVITPILEKFLENVRIAEADQLRSDKEKYKKEISSNNESENE